MHDVDLTPTFADLFCGIGGFHLAASELGLRCAFASDIDRGACETYKVNFGIQPYGDIVKIPADQVPDHDILFAGLPCQPFSIIGKRTGFSDARGNLFLEVARIAATKLPQAIVIENVRQFTTLDGGKALRCVIATLEALGYSVAWRILNALDFGLPQKRERVFVVATTASIDFDWPNGDIPMQPLGELLESNPDKCHFASERIQNARKRAHRATTSPMIWHENKGGNVSSHPYSCALRAGASYNYLLVDGKRRLTPRELFRLQGFPDNFQLPRSIAAARRLTGNAVPVPMARAVIDRVMETLTHR
ncbi:MAG: DNA cytosine methyltransferase [Gammaproteobacteria bacterium]|nr:DNA cytosine methyltransferase [Gammaproteobacteria bacterium]